MDRFHKREHDLGQVLDLSKQRAPVRQRREHANQLVVQLVGLEREALVQRLEGRVRALPHEPLEGSLVEWQR